MASASMDSRSPSSLDQLESAAWVYFRPECQFRPLRTTGPAPYQIRVAAGIKTSSDFIPPYSPTTPSNISRTDHPIDFFQFALMNKHQVSEFQSFNDQSPVGFRLFNFET